VVAHRARVTLAAVALASRAQLTGGNRAVGHSARRRAGLPASAAIVSLHRSRVHGTCPAARSPGPGHPLRARRRHMRVPARAVRGAQQVATAAGERTEKTGPPEAVGASSEPSQKCSANGRSGNARASSRRSDSGWASGICACAAVVADLRMGCQTHGVSPSLEGGLPDPGDLTAEARGLAGYGVLRLRADNPGPLTAVGHKRVDRGPQSGLCRGPRPPDRLPHTATPHGDRRARRPRRHRAHSRPRRPRRSRRSSARARSGAACGGSW